MKPLVKACCDSWEDGCCRLSSSVEGWGCRLMVCLPDKMPRTEQERGKLFHKVYTYAEKCGVLDCPHFRENIIDEVIDDPYKLRELVLICNRSRADLLSDNFETPYN